MILSAEPCSFNDTINLIYHNKSNISMFMIVRCHFIACMFTPWSLRHITFAPFFKAIPQHKSNILVSLFYY